MARGHLKAPSRSRALGLIVRSSKVILGLCANSVEIIIVLLSFMSLAKNCVTVVGFNEEFVSIRIRLYCVTARPRFEGIIVRHPSLLPAPIQITEKLGFEFVIFV